jgi:hypothetical protein
MPVMTLYEEVENILTNRLKNALRTGEIINAPDWVSDVAACLALAVTMVEEQDRPGLQAFAHRELDRFIAKRIAEKAQDEPEWIRRRAIGVTLSGNDPQIASSKSCASADTQFKVCEGIRLRCTCLG